MRRCLALLLLCLLPMQWSWAAMAGYCTHESSAPAQHLGHHEHHHQRSGLDQAMAGHDRSDAPAGVEAAKALGSADVDCSQCHGCCAAVPRSGQALGLLKPASTPANAAPCMANSPVAEPPDRPQWGTLA